MVVMTMMLLAGGFSDSSLVANTALRPHTTVVGVCYFCCFIQFLAASFIVFLVDILQAEGTSLKDILVYYFISFSPITELLLCIYVLCRGRIKNLTLAVDSPFRSSLILQPRRRRPELSRECSDGVHFSPLPNDSRHGAWATQHFLKKFESLKSA